MRLYRRDKPEESCESGIRGRKVQKNHADNSAIPSPGTVVIFSRNGLNLQYSSGKAGIGYPDSLSGRGILVTENPA